VALTADRPKPVLEAARIWALVAGGLGALLTFAVSNGVLTAAQADAVNTGSSSISILFSALLTAIPALTGVFAAFGTAKQAEKDVTPNSSPATLIGTELVPLVPGTRTGALDGGI
jgi:hypothetical protein